MAIHQCPHCNYETLRISTFKRNMALQHEASTYDSQSANEGDIFDRLSTNGSESWGDDEGYSWSLDKIFSAALCQLL